MRLINTFRTAGRQYAEVGLDIYNFANFLNHRWGAEYQLPVGISNQNPVVQRIPLLNVVGFNQATRQYTYTVNENFGVLQKGGNPYQIQLAVRYGFYVRSRFPQDPRHIRTRTWPRRSGRASTVSTLREAATRPRRQWESSSRSLACNPCACPSTV